MGTALRSQCIQFTPETLFWLEFVILTLDIRSDTADIRQKYEHIDDLQIRVGRKSVDCKMCDSVLLIRRGWAKIYFNTIIRPPNIIYRAIIYRTIFVVWAG